MQLWAIAIAVWCTQAAFIGWWMDADGWVPFGFLTALVIVCAIGFVASQHTNNDEPKDEPISLDVSGLM